MTTLEVLIYLVLLCLGILFSSLALNYKSGVLSFIAMLCWFVTGGTHMVIAWDSTVYYVATLYLGFAGVFMVVSFYYLFMNIQRAVEQNKDRKDWELP